MAGMKNGASDPQKVYRMKFGGVYPLYVQKAERKGRTKEEVDRIIFWLTGYDEVSLKAVMEAGADFEAFFENAPVIHPNVSLIKGSICGYRVEEIEDKTVRLVRCLDKLVDELAKGRPMEKILRE